MYKLPNCEVAESLKGQNFPLTQAMNPFLGKRMLLTSVLKSFLDCLFATEFSQTTRFTRLRKVQDVIFVKWLIVVNSYC